MNTHSVIVGINDFPGTGSDLSGCINDARDIQRLLSPNRATSPSAIDRLPFFHCANSINSLIDNQAKLKASIEAVGTMLQKLGDGDLGFLWFSQHGTFTDESQRHEALVFHDFGLWVDTKIVKLICQRNPKSLLFIGTDACHTGTRGFGDEDKPRFLNAAQFPVAVEHPIQMPGWREVERLLPAKSLDNVIHFAGCQASEVCYDTSFNGRANGAFTYYLLKSLSTLQPGATYGDWFKAVCKSLPTKRYPQRPSCNAKPNVLATPLPLRKG